MWDVADGKRLDSFKFEPVRYGIDEFLEWSPDGKRLVVAMAATADRTLTVHDAETGSVEAGRWIRLPAAVGLPERGPAFSPDGRPAAAAAAAVKVWDAATGRELLELPSNKHRGAGLAEAVSPPRGLRRRREPPARLHPEGPDQSRRFWTARGQRDVIDVTTWDATPREGPKKP